MNIMYYEYPGAQKPLLMMNGVDPSIELQSVSMSHSLQFALQGLSDALAVTADPSNPALCPGFGQPGWGPFCFLNGNPVFNAFDQFQQFVQGSVVSLHDILSVIWLYEMHCDTTWWLSRLIHSDYYPGHGSGTRVWPLNRVIYSPCATSVISCDISTAGIKSKDPCPCSQTCGD